MKRFALVLMFVTLAVALFAVPAVVVADNYGISDTLNEVNKQDPTRPLLPQTVAGKSSVPEVIGAVVGIGLSLIGVIFFLLTLFAGFRWMTAMGNSENVEKAKDTLITAAIGLIIVLAAYALTSLLFSRLAPSGPAAAPSTSNGGTGTCEQMYPSRHPACVVWNGPDCPVDTKISIKGEGLCPGKPSDVQCCIDKP